MSAIDASRFSGVGLSPWARSTANATVWYFQHPQDAIRIINSGVLTPNYANPEKGSAAYHYEPRTGAAVEIAQFGLTPELAAWEGGNGQWKRAHYLKLAPPDKFIEAVEADWYGYCKMFQERDGDNRPWPRYPWTADDLEKMSQLEVELGRAREETRASAWTTREGAGAQAKKVCTPGSDISFEAAKAVLRVRARSPTSKTTAEEKEAARKAITWMNENTSIQQK
eukprot:gnl/TRDRNA2_/TRDRNA2_174456_c0_seq1.p1 gnl/TRDRNA2_/TRDRNA2_174456_c0~~gnl/TRDRNA2_/TRDRNA2_174456_c0_seq1.p1  ORF type:complete len:248 (+),score=38.05 gnl/TRDRNA2_/TRDRNA2_174456_c0_seq1:71-745(+)